MGAFVAGIAKGSLVSLDAGGDIEAVDTPFSERELRVEMLAESVCNKYQLVGLEL